MVVYRLYKAVRSALDGEGGTFVWRVLESRRATASLYCRQP